MRNSGAHDRINDCNPMVFLRCLDYFFCSTFLLSGIYLRGWGPRGPGGPRGPAGFFGAQGSEAPSGAEVKFSNLNCNFNGFNDINCPPPPTPTPIPKKSALTSSKLLIII